MPRHPIGTRAAYARFITLPTRWMDNDVYGHVNNVIHYAWFDTAVAHFLLANRVLDIGTSAEVGLVVETQCRYFAPIAFPDMVTIGLRADRVGRTSVTYGLAVFRNEEDQASAEGHFVHVYVERANQSRTVPLPASLLAALATLQ